jgi:hypothetical protein
MFFKVTRFKCMYRTIRRALKRKTRVTSEMKLCKAMAVPAFYAGVKHGLRVKDVDSRDRVSAYTRI